MITCHKMTMIRAKSQVNRRPALHWHLLMKPLPYRNTPCSYATLPDLAVASATKFNSQQGSLSQRLKQWYTCWFSRREEVNTSSQYISTHQAAVGFAWLLYVEEHWMLLADSPAKLPWRGHHSQHPSWLQTHPFARAVSKQPCCQHWDARWSQWIVLPWPSTPAEQSWLAKSACTTHNSWCRTQIVTLKARLQVCCISCRAVSVDKV